jgi:hypothetical protein
MGKHPRYGWVPDLPDNRDLLPAASVLRDPLPSGVDLGGKRRPVYDPGQLGSRGGNAIAGSLDLNGFGKGSPQDEIQPDSREPTITRNLTLANAVAVHKLSEIIADHSSGGGSFRVPCAAPVPAP